MGSNLSGIMEAAIKIAARRRDTLARIEAALQRGDEQAALILLREYLNMEPKDEKSNRASSRIN